MEPLSPGEATRRAKPRAQAPPEPRDESSELAEEVVHFWQIVRAGTDDPELARNATIMFLGFALNPPLIPYEEPVYPPPR
jgi:hypothetical protein